MEVKSRRPFSNLKSWKWQNVILLALMTFYLTNFGFRVANYRFPAYGQDYLAFWSAGKVADKEGYSKIYELQAMRTVEGQVLRDLGVIRQVNDPSFMTLPALYLPVFLVPFQILSQFPIQTSLVIWWVFNFLLLTGYLFYFTKTRTATLHNDKDWIFLVLLAMLSYPVFDNFLEGQINVFLLIFVGEFIRNAEKGRPFVSGLWLAGLLLKPQLLIIVVPLMLILRYWKVVFGFLACSFFLLATSWALSGTEGITGFINLLMRAGTGAATSSPEAMINWRMVGINLNNWTHSSIGWVITALGMVITLVAVGSLTKRKPDFGSRGWLMVMVGVFSATLAFTWHAHNHMAIIMIPLLLMTIASGMLQKQTLNIWVLGPPLGWLGAGLSSVVLQKIYLLGNVNFLGFAIAFSTFIVNLAILVTVTRWKCIVSVSMNQIKSQR
ncbi:MAG: glycosyltransferase family 87 protein [Smithella sp.]